MNFLNGTKPKPDAGDGNYEGGFCRRTAAFRGGRKVYTEDVGSSSLSSPTIVSKAFRAIYEVTLRFNEPGRLLNEIPRPLHGSRSRRPSSILASGVHGVLGVGSIEMDGGLVWKRTWPDSHRDFSCTDEQGNRVGRIYFNEHPNPISQWFWSYYGDGSKSARSGLCGTKDEAVRAVVEAHEG